MSTEQLLEVAVAANFEKKLNQESVITSVTNREFEGLIRDGGETVKIIEESEVTINNSLGLDGGPIEYDELTPTSQELYIDEDPYAVIRISDREQEQIKSGKVKEVIKKATDRIYKKFETHVEDTLAEKYSDSGLVYTASTVTITKSNAFEYLNRMATLFDRNNLGEFEQDWCAMLPPEFVGLLELDTANQYTESGALIRKNGLMGRLGRWSIYNAPAIKEDGNDIFHPLFLVKGQAIALAMQTTPKMQDATRPNYFETAYKFRMSYGAKGYNPSKLGTLPCVFSYA